MHRSAAHQMPRQVLAAAVLCVLALAGCQRTTTLDDSRAEAQVGAQRDQSAPAADEEVLESAVITSSEARRARQETTKPASRADAAAKSAGAVQEVDKIEVTGSRVARLQERKGANGIVADGYVSAPPPPPSPAMMIAPAEPMPQLANTEH